MSEELNGVELFKLLMPPQATAGEIAQMNLETLARKVEYRRKRKVSQAAVDANLTDEQIAQAILDYAHSVPPDTRVTDPPAEERPTYARLLFLIPLFLTFAAILLGILGWYAWYASGTRPYPVESFEYVLPYVLPLLGISVFVGLAFTAWAFLYFRPRSRGRTTRTLVLVGISMLLVAILVTALLMSPINGQHLKIQLLAARRYFEGVELEYAALAGVDLSGANLRRANLSQADLTGADLRGANLHQANLTGADLRGANLNGTELREARLEGTMLDDTAPIAAKYFLIREVVTQGAVGRDLRDADLSWANLRGANLKGASLSGADLRWADLGGADLSYADLREADLFMVRLSGADLTGATVTDEQLAQADTLEGATLPDGSVHE